MPAIVPAPLRAYSARELRDGMRDGRLDAAQVLGESLREAERLQPTLHAIRALNPHASAEHRAGPLGVSPSASQHGPLAGLPFTVKDTIEVAGLPTTGGSLLLRESIPARSASLVDRLLAAGAVLLGKATCAEFGIGNGEAWSPLTGQTRNPWDVRRTPGGSSGGDSAAVSAGISAFGVGTDFGGSVRWPAHCTGIAALRPTVGRLPLDGQLPQFAASPFPSAVSRVQQELQTPGFLARSVDDLALLLEVGSGAPLKQHRSRRVGWFVDEVDPAVENAIERAAETLATFGIEVVRIPTPDVAEAARVLAELRATDGAPEIAWLAHGREHLLGSLVRAQVRAGIHEARDGLEADVRRWRAWADETFRSVDVLLMPVAAGPAWVIEPYDQPDRSAYDRCTRMVTLLGLPAVVVPAGISPEGLPIGVQLAAAQGRDEDALHAAHLIESVLGRWNPRLTAESRGGSI